MTDQAIAKINAEMQKNPSDPYTEIIGHYVIDRCMNESAAAKVCADKKTLKGAMEAVMTEARKAIPKNHGSGVGVYMPPGDVFGAVDRYFGLPIDLAAQQKAMSTAGGAAHTQPAPPEPPAKVKFDLADFF